ncbi:MAG: hypothetical protein GY739_07390 [Mesoflavibacter sp.]|nr:hypothetical protein [Mesoflavibacter sp.]
MPLFSAKERKFLMDLDSQNIEMKECECDCNDELKNLIQTVKNLTERVKELENVNTKTKERFDILEKEKASDSEVRKVKKILNIEDKPRPQNLNSISLDPYLTKIGSSAHIPNVSDIGVAVAQEKWKYKDTHFKAIASKFGNHAQIVKIVQLKQKVDSSGQTSFPVNIYFSSETHRNQAINFLRNVCKNQQILQPNIQFALSGFPDVQGRVKETASTLSSMKANKKIANYCISNFCLSDNIIIPLYQVKWRKESPWSKTKDSKTTIYFSSGNPEQTPTLAELITEHIKDLKESQNIPPPPPKNSLHDFISDKLESQNCSDRKPEGHRSPSKRQLQKDDTNIGEKDNKIPKNNSSFISAFAEREENTAANIPPPFPIQMNENERKLNQNSAPIAQDISNFPTHLIPPPLLPHPVCTNNILNRQHPGPYLPHPQTNSMISNNSHNINFPSLPQPLLPTAIPHQHYQPPPLPNSSTSYLSSMV